MNKSKAKLPQKSGAQKAAQIFEGTRKNVPSDRLVKIISEIPAVEPNQNPKVDDRAAKDAEI